MTVVVSTSREARSGERARLLGSPDFYCHACSLVDYASIYTAV